jgi:hypothetical protein
MVMQVKTYGGKSSGQRKTASTKVDNSYGAMYGKGKKSKKEGKQEITLDFYSILCYNRAVVYNNNL